MRAVVTGASGFVGGYLVRELLRRGHGVTGLVRNPSSAAELRALGMQARAGDITAPDTLDGTFRGHDVVFHLAAVVGKDPGGWDNHLRNGVQGTENVLRRALAEGVPRFVHLSSCVVYRRPERGHILSEDSPLESEIEPWNHYVRQKLVTEELVFAAGNRLGVTVIRPPTVLGPGDPNLIPYLRAIQSSPLGIVARDADLHFAVIVAEDLAAALVDAGERSAALGKAYNVAARERLTKAQLFASFERAGVRFEPGSKTRQLVLRSVAVGVNAIAAAESLLGGGRVSLPRRRVIRALEGHAQRRAQADWVLDCSRARRDLGFEGARDCQEAIARSVTWYQQLQT